MIWIYLASTAGFLFYVALLAWKRFEASENDFDILTLYLKRFIVLLFYAGVFGIFGVVYNADTFANASAPSLPAKLILLPDLLPLLRAFSIGLAGPLAAAQLMLVYSKHSSEKDTINREDGPQVDDINHEPRTGEGNWFYRNSRVLFLQD